MPAQPAPDITKVSVGAIGNKVRELKNKEWINKNGERINMNNDPHKVARYMDAIRAWCTAPGRRSCHTWLRELSKFEAKYHLEIAFVAAEAAQAVDNAAQAADLAAHVAAGLSELDRREALEALEANAAER